MKYEGKISSHGRVTAILLAFRKKSLYRIAITESVAEALKN